MPYYLVLVYAILNASCHGFIKDKTTRLYKAWAFKVAEIITATYMLSSVGVDTNIDIILWCEQAFQFKCEAVWNKV